MAVFEVGLGEDLAYLIGDELDWARLVGVDGQYVLVHLTLKLVYNKCLLYIRAIG